MGGIQKESIIAKQFKWASRKRNRILMIAIFFSRAPSTFSFGRHFYVCKHIFEAFGNFVRKSEIRGPRPLTSLAAIQAALHIEP
jgi:hypothetical protein